MGEEKKALHGQGRETDSQFGKPEANAGAIEF